MIESADDESLANPRSQVAPIRSIVVATDLSDGSESLLRVAGELAARSGAALHVVHAAEASSGAAADPSGGLAEQVASLESLVDAQIRQAVPAAVLVDRYVEISPPDRAITEHADRVDADLIVVGPHVRAAGPTRLLGSTAERVLGASRVPCLVVRAPLVTPSHHVVAAVDPAHTVGPVLDSAVRWALLLSDPEQARRPPRLSALYVRSGADDNASAGLADALRSALARNDAGSHLNAGVAVRGTDVVQSILLYTEAEAADLLVLATRNRGVIERALIGSVSAEVTRRAPCNVLLVPPPNE